jgi:hypothetical protein
MQTTSPKASSSFVPAKPRGRTTIRLVIPAYPRHLDRLDVSPALRYTPFFMYFYLNRLRIRCVTQLARPNPLQYCVRVGEFSFLLTSTVSKAGFFTIIVRIGCFVRWCVSYLDIYVMVYVRIRLLHLYDTCCVYIIGYSLIYMLMCIAWSDQYVNVYDRIFVLTKSQGWNFGGTA